MAKKREHRVQLKNFKDKAHKQTYYWKRTIKDFTYLVEIEELQQVDEHFWLVHLPTEKLMAHDTEYIYYIKKEKEQWEKKN